MMVKDHRHKVAQQLRQIGLLNERIEHCALLLGGHRWVLPHFAQRLALLHPAHDCAQLLGDFCRVTSLLEEQVSEGAGIAAGDGRHQRPFLPNWSVKSRTSAWSAAASILIFFSASSTASDAA